LTAYKAEQYEPLGSNHPSKVVIADVLLYYGRKALPETKRPRELTHIIERLNNWWGRKHVSDIKESTCRAYVARRGPEAEVAARNELAYLRAAVRRWHREYPVDCPTTVHIAPASTRPRALATARRSG
jgi:hypothetical protein